MRFLATISYASIAYGAFSAFDSGDTFQAAFRSNSSRLLDGGLANLLGARQEEVTCTFPEPWVTCPDDVHCCPGDLPQCCEGYGTCCPTTAACFAKGLCCPHTAETCGKGFCLGKGQTCCGEFYCEIGIKCLKSSSGSEVCCSTDEIACDPDYCCPEGSLCVGDGLCEHISESTSTQMSTSTRTSTKTSAATSTNTATRTSTKTTSISSSVCKPTSTAKRDLDSRHDKRQTADDPGDYLLVNGKCLPVMDFPCVEGLSDQLCASMCGGIQQELAGTHKSQVLSSTTMVLTWRGSRVADPTCRNLGCTGLRDPAGDTMECDEFPPASTLEGGPGSHKICISWKQNRGLQGPLIRQYGVFYNLQPNDQFIVRMGSCASVSSGLQNRGDSNDDSPKVDAGRDGHAILSSGSTWWIADPRGTGTGFIVIPLSNVTAGAYNCTLSFENLDHLESLDIVDGDGYAYWSQSAPFSAPDFAPSFSVNDTDDLVVAAAAAQSTSVSASIEATLTPKAPSAANPMVPLKLLKVLMTCGLLIWGLVVIL